MDAGDSLGDRVNQSFIRAMQGLGSWFPGNGGTWMHGWVVSFCSPAPGGGSFGWTLPLVQPCKLVLALLIPLASAL